MDPTAFFLLGVFVLALLVGAVVLQHQRATRASDAANKEIAGLTAQLAWYRWYFSEYAATLRHQQYGKPTLDINNLFVRGSPEFIRIEDVTRKLLCPLPANGAYTNEYIYFGARMLPLPRQASDEVDFYSISYLGSGEFAHSGKVFDALIEHQQVASPEEFTELSLPFGLAERWLAKRGYQDLVFTPKGEYGHYRPMSYNADDVDGDGRADFIFAGHLMLSSRGYREGPTVPRESIFVGNRVLSLMGEQLTISAWDGEQLVLSAERSLAAAAARDLPHVLVPLPGKFFGVRTDRGLDVFEAGKGDLCLRAWISGLAPGEVLTGAFGDFTGDGLEDFWLSQVATPTKYPNKQDRLIMVPMRALLDAGGNEIELEDVAYFTIRGSSAYSDYDGISTTLSPKAGDIDGDGLPDLTFSGHRHMNEAGAMYVLLGSDIKPGGTIDLTAPELIKILGRPMSQLAPPYQHWDATDFTGDGHDDIVVPADNDLCAGLNAGAIYVIDGKRLIDAKRGRGSR